MRLYPPAYFMDRVNLEDDEYDGIFIKKGSNLLFSMYEIHRHEKYWKDPYKFDPDRFSEENAKEHSSHYFPFGAGPRMCIGNNFAMYEMIITIAELVKNFRIHPVLDEIKIKPLITLKPKDAILRFEER